MITFAGKRVPSYVKVVGIEYSILPPITHKALDVMGRMGVYDFGTELGARKITATIKIIGDNQNDVMKKARSLAAWLYYDELQPLIIDDEPDKYYMARVINETDITEIFRVGQGTIEFICPYGYAESTASKIYTHTPSSETDVLAVVNNGTYKTFPVIELTALEDINNITVVTEKGFIRLGEPPNLDLPNAKKSPTVLKDAMTTVSGWGAGVGVDGGVISGSFSSNGYRFSATYGSGSAWYGAALMKGLPRAVQDFEVTAEVGFESTDVKQIGRIEVYLFDENNNNIGKVAIVDSTNTADNPRVEARAGGAASGYYFVSSYGSRSGAFSKYKNGILRIGRKGSVWYAYFAKIASDGSHTSRLYKEWRDTKNLFTSKLAKIQIHIGAYGSYPSVNTMYIEDIKVAEHLNVSKESNNIIYIEQGDKIVIDNDKALILLNGEPAFHLLEPSSDFIHFDTGVNVIGITPAKASMKVTFVERWL